MLRSSEMHHFPPGMTSSEYKKMIQLTRAPHGKTGLLDDAPRMSDLMKQTDENQNFVTNERTQILGKRDSVTHFQTMPPKKLRKTNFFECSDCGVRYRKEENYVIHKQVYCKFKKTDNNANLKNLPIFSQLPINIDAATSRYSVIHKTAQSEPYLPPSTQTTPLQSNSLKIQSFLQSEIGTNPTSFLHNDLCRTKSADAALQTDRRNSSESQPHISAKSPGNSFSPTANNSSTVITTANPLSQNPPCNCIPTSKLPPNKRHMQLLRCSVETTRNQTHSTTTVIPTTSSSVRKVSAPLLQTQPEEANVSDRKLSLQNTWKPNEKNSSFFDECSVPRSNYKLLLHQMSLRNLQDINLIKQSPLITQSENSIWSWEQMCKIGKSPQFINTNKNSLQSDNPIKDISAVSDTVERNTPSLNHSAMGISYANQGGDILPINKPFPPSKGNIDEGEMRSNNDLIVPSVMQGMSSNNLPQCDQKQVEGSDENVGERCNTLNSETDSKDNLNDIGGDKCSDDLLYPHLKPVFYGNAHVSYCCLANPQPTFTKLEPDANQLSMYSKWAVAEPLLLPENITVVDLLASWRKIKNGFICGISVPSKDTHKLLVTDSKSYNKKSEEDKETTATNKDKIIESSESSPADDKSELNIPKQYECDFFKGNSKYVYTSCSAKYCNGAEDDKSTSSDICDVKLHRKIPEKVPSEEDSISSPVKCSVKISLPSNSTKSSSIESDSGHREVRKLGRVKKRKTRKERSAASPREKRRALYSQSPPSPFRQMAVHQSESCKGQTDDSLKGCALCSIKAGRSDLVPEVSSACKPCREAAISNEKSPNVETLSLSNSTSPSKFSSMYHSPVPEHTNGYLDRTRASGNTQHWMTKSTPNESTSTSAFHYPVLERNDKVSKANPSSPPNTPLTAPEGHPDPVRSPCTPQLAEVVSEVIRTAAIQSKRQGNPHSHPLSHSRPLIPVTSSTYKSANDSSLRTPVNKQNSLALPVSNHASMTSSAPKRNDVAVTSSADAQAPVECDNGDVIALTNGYGKLGRRNLVLSSRESELFLHKANNLSSASASYGKESRPESHCTKASAAEISGEPSEKETACQDEYMSCESDAESEREEYDDFKKADATARPYICVECKVAFRIGGHLAKHLRSKGHTLMMQKKTLNRLKQQQHKVSGAGISLDPDFVASQENETIANLVAAESTAVSSATKPQVLSGTEGLARSQVRALFEGNDEYACVPHCDDVIDGNDDVINPQDPRPFKCLACDVAFRFQGHLDRHFRSNLHLIAVGHYEHDVTTSSHPPYDVTNPSHPTHDDSNVEEKDNEEELIVDGEPSPTPCTDTLSSTVVNSNNTEQSSGPIQNHSSSLLAMTSHKDAGDVTPSALSNYDKNEIDRSNNNYLGNYCIDESQIRQESNKLNPADGAMGRHNHQVAIPCQMISGFRT